MGPYLPTPVTPGEENHSSNPVVLPGSPQPLSSPPYNLPRQSRSSSLGNSVAYLGRPEYLPGEFTTGANASHDSVPASSAPEVDREFLRLFKAFELPPRAVRAGLISNFLHYCTPWMPVADFEDLQLQSAPNVADSPSAQGRTSLLLTQAVFVAGSRVPSSRLLCANSAHFYNRAKALFFADVEPDPLKTIAALCLMQWYNPSGAEHVSIHSSCFWLRVAVALAYQVGLHREPDPRSQDCKFRRRLFWSLFVGLPRQLLFILANQSVFSAATASSSSPTAAHERSIWTTAISVFPPLPTFPAQPRTPTSSLPMSTSAPSSLSAARWPMGPAPHPRASRSAAASTAGSASSPPCSNSTMLSTTISKSASST